MESSRHGLDWRRVLLSGPGVRRQHDSGSLCGLSASSLGFFGPAVAVSHDGVYVCGSVSFLHVLDRGVSHSSFHGIFGGHGLFGGGISGGVAAVWHMGQQQNALLHWLLYLCGGNCKKKKNGSVLSFDVLLLAQGQLLRWAAFVTAGHNFTHLVAENKEAKHALVTGGVYKYVRHPGYCGWFWWSVGTQRMLFLFILIPFLFFVFSSVMLANPISTLAFAYFSYRFFAERIPNEEAALSSPEFFGEQYKKYKAQTPTYIPFIA